MEQWVHSSIYRAREQCERCTIIIFKVDLDPNILPYCITQLAQCLLIWEPHSGEALARTQRPRAASPKIKQQSARSESFWNLFWPTADTCVRYSQLKQLLIDWECWRVLEIRERLSAERLLTIKCHARSGLQKSKSFSLISRRISLGTWCAEMARPTSRQRKKKHCSSPCSTPDGFGSPASLPFDWVKCWLPGPAHLHIQSAS